VTPLPRKIIEQKDISIPEAKTILETVEEPTEFQRRTLDYLTKFAKVDPSHAEKLIAVLVKKHKLESKEAIQIVNCMPKSVEELRAILSVKGKVVIADELESIFQEIDKFRL